MSVSQIKQVRKKVKFYYLLYEFLNHDKFRIKKTFLEHRKQFFYIIHYAIPVCRVCGPSRT